MEDKNHTELEYLGIKISFNGDKCQKDYPVSYRCKYLYDTLTMKSSDIQCNLFSEILKRVPTSKGTIYKRCEACLKFEAAARYSQEQEDGLQWKAGYIAALQYTVPLRGS